MTPLPPLAPGHRVRIAASPSWGLGAGELGTVVYVRRRRECDTCGGGPGIAHAADCTRDSGRRLRWRVTAEVLLDSVAAAGLTCRVEYERGELEVAE